MRSMFITAATLAFCAVATGQPLPGTPATTPCANCGVVGGVLGHQIGSGRGNTAATILGAGAGAYAGNQIEKNAKKKTYWVVSVRLDDGSKQSITSGAKPAFKQGDRVKVVDGKRLALLAN